MEEAFLPSSLFPKPAPAMSSAGFDANLKPNLSFDVKEKIVKLVVSSIKDDPVEERSIDLTHDPVEERSIDDLVEDIMKQLSEKSSLQCKKVWMLDLSLDVKEILELVRSSIIDHPVEERSIDLTHDLVEESTHVPVKKGSIDHDLVKKKSIDFIHGLVEAILKGLSVKSLLQCRKVCESWRASVPVEEGSIDHDRVEKRSIDLIHDLVKEILKRLPVKSLLQCRKVCKSWRANIDDCGFVNLHLKQASNWHLVCFDLSQRVYIFSDKSLSMSERKIPGKSLSMSEKEIPFAKKNKLYALVGSCNGLICVAERSQWMYLGPMYLWNLFTGEFKCVKPYRSDDERLISIGSSVGFCFHSESKAYKILMIVRSTDIECEILIYSHKTDSWTSLKCKVPDEVPAFCYFSLPTVCFNGSIYWFFPKRRAKSLVLFNLTKEVFDEMAISEEIISGGEIVAISIVKDMLAVCTIHKEGQHSAGSGSVWVKDKPDSWTLWYSFPDDRRVKGFDGFMRNGELLMVKDDNARVSYNPVNNQLTDYQLTDYQPLKVKSNLITVIESLVSFKTSSKTPHEMPPHLSCLSLQI